MSIAAFFDGQPTIPEIIAEAGPLAGLAQPDASMATLASTAPLSLGEFDFDDYSGPSDLKFGTKQALTVHKMIGGGRVIDATGPDYDAITWAGLFFGTDAEDKAIQFQAMTEGGQSHVLAWGRFNFDVVLESVTYDYISPHEIAYSASAVILEVRESLATPPSIVQATEADLAAASRVSLDGLPDLSGLTRGIAIIRAGTAQATAIYNRVMAIRGRVQTAIANGQAIIAGLGAIGNGSPMQTIGAMNAAAAALQSLSAASATNGYLGRMARRLLPGV